MLTRWNALDREFDNLFRNLVFRDVALPQQRFAAEAKFLAPADIVETEAGFEVKVDLPGHDPKSIQVELDKDTLKLSAERRAEARAEKDTWHRQERVHGTFTRSFKLPTTVDGDRIEARYEHGVLTVVIPKKEEVKPRTIEVKVG